MHPVDIATLLREVLHVIDTANPDCVHHLDSGADSIELLCNLEDELRDTVLDLCGVYPAVELEQFDLTN